MTAEIESLLLVGTDWPLRGTVKVYLALGSTSGFAPSNSMVMEVGGGGGGGGEEPLPQLMDLTVCGGPTFQFPGEVKTRAGGKSTVVRVQTEGTSMEAEMLEMERTLSGVC
jgi:hypothetical protein